MILLPVIAYALMVLLGRWLDLGWRRAMLQSAVFWGLLITASTELLSIPHWLERGPLAAAWLGAVLVGAGCLVVVARGRRAVLITAAPGFVSLTLDWPERLMLLAIAAICVAICIVAVTAPPNTWDAMEYHLPRVFFWMQNHGVQNYQTPDYAQLVFSPFAEFTMLQSYMLARSDRFVNLVEFLSFAGSVVGVSLIAERLGANRREQIFAALVCATIPEGLLEASGAMNTFVVTFWIVATVYFMLLWREEQSWPVLVMIGGSAGLAILTKGSAYVYLPPIMLACWLSGPPSSGWKLLKCVPAVTIIIALVNVGAFTRNLDLTGSPLGLPFRDGGPRLHWMNDNFSPVATVANVIRNVTLHLGTPFGFLNRMGESAVRSMLQFMGQDPDDPTHTWLSGLGFRWPMMSRNEIFAGNLLHALLIAAAMAILLIRLRDRRWRGVQIYVLGPIGAFILFSALMRYQIWEARHHLPLFVLMAAALGLLVPRLLGQRMTVATAMLLVVTALPFAAANNLRSLVPAGAASIETRSRNDLYFADQHFDRASINEALVARVNESSCRTIGIDAHVGRPAATLVKSVPSFFVYPILAMLDRTGPGRTFQYVDVQNLSRRFMPASPYRPCLVICLDCADIPESFRTYDGWKSRSVGNNLLFENPSDQGRAARSAGYTLVEP